MTEIAKYNGMMSYLTRPPAPPKTQVADLVDDLEPGSLKDELKEKFDPSQETYEEYLQRKGLGERPFNASNGGSPKEEIAEPSKSMQVDTLASEGKSMDEIMSILQSTPRRKQAEGGLSYLMGM